MAVRNFYIDAVIDGRKTDLSGGPRNRDGGLSATVFVRDEGSIETGVKINAWVGADDQLILQVEDDQGKIIHKKVTKR